MSYLTERKTMDDSKPIFIQVAERIENDILDGSLVAHDQVPSTNQISAFYRINPATAGKGINLLVEREIIYKERGIGMFVADKARDIIAKNRSAEFRQDFLIPLVSEAKKLGITTENLISMMKEESGK